MEQYISKSALAAEIERRRDYNAKEFYPGRLLEDNYFLDFLDTLEVKEVDLDKSVTHYLLHEHRSPLNEVMHQSDLKSEMQYHKDIEHAYKAGFELGLKVQKREEV